MPLSDVAAQRRFAMASSSVSFRISRHTEDLAITLHALSQRLVALEQRLDGLAAELHQKRPDEADAEDLARLDKAESLLRDCRQLLDAESRPTLDGGRAGLSTIKAAALEAAASKEAAQAWDAA
jgi:hypothetical protein